MIRPWIALLLGGMLAVFCASPSRAAENILHRAIASEPATLDPQQASTPSESAITADLFEGLLTPDVQGRPTLGLADSWMATPDGKHYTFHLRQNLSWSDGKPINANDVVESFHRLMDPKTSRFAALFAMVKNVGAPDASTIVFDLDSPARYFLALLARPFAAVVPVETVAADARAEPGAFVSNGAFKLEAWKPGDRITLASNPRFHDAQSLHLDRVIYYPVADTASIIVRYRAGAFDIDGDFPEAQLDALHRNFPNDLKVDPALTSTYLAVNTVKISDHRVRRALSIALDREILTTNVLRDGAQPAASFVPPVTAGYTPATMDFVAWKPEERVAEARRLLAEAGFDAKHPLHVTISYTATPTLRLVMVMIADMWKQVGVETASRDVQYDALFTNLQNGGYDIALLSWAADVNDAASFLEVLQSGNTQTNFARYDNPRFDEFVEHAEATSVTADRANLLRDAEAIVMAEQPIIPLYFGVSRNLVAARVGGWIATPDDVHPSRYLTVRAPHG